ncbi:hypothetical protein SNE40_007619 [Patella caerulea]|uniref:Uncharacterized protein n=1 Tax=Patella caerulea TaxID=87958 RepID=A0AAN8PXP0_PATCE
MEKVNPSTSLATPSERLELAESDCIRYCEDDSSASDQCYAVQVEAPSTCRVYKSTDNNMFVKRSEESLLDSTGSNIYRKVCYEGN